MPDHSGDDEYRVIPADDLDQLNEVLRLTTYAFRPTQSFEPHESLDDVPSAMLLATFRGIVRGEELRAVCGHHWLTLRVRGEWQSVAGLSAVATPPGNRRQGLVYRLLRESLAEYRDRGIPFSALWPFEHAFYRKYGWGRCSDYARIACPPSTLSFADEHASGTFVELESDDWERLAGVFERSQTRAMAMRRTEAWWRERVIEGWFARPHVVGWERDGGLCGYLVYTFEEGAGDDGRTLSVQELVATDHEALLNCLRFCRYHDSQVERVEFREPAAFGRTLFDLAHDPQEVEVELRPGPQFRVVDVERGLAALDYPADGELTLAVDDGTAEWNDDNFRLSVVDGEASCERTDAPTDTTVDIATLSQLVAGSLSVEGAAVVGELVADESARETLGTLFPEPDREPFLREFF